MIRARALVLLAFPAFAAAGEDALVAGRLLSESATARPSGLAETGTALVGDLTALSFNPAGLPYMKRSELSTRFQSSEGDVTSGAFTYGGRRRGWGWGLGVSFLDAGDINLAFSDGRRFTRDAQRDLAAQAGLGWGVSESFSMGVGARYVSSKLVDEFSASAVAVDAGLVLRVSEGWFWGASVRNMGGELKYRSQGDPLPGEVRVGTAYSYSPYEIDRRPEDVPTDEWYMRDQEETPIFTLLLDGVRDQEGSTSGAAAFEWTKWPKSAFRVGYGLGENATGLTLGFGLNMLTWSLDYSWRFVQDLSPAHRLSFSLYWE